MNDYLPEKENSVVSGESVASIYSPAAYLTELWKEANTLHATNSQYSLRTRRPDFESLVLSQENMDEAVNTQTLTNELLSQIYCNNYSLAYDSTLLKSVLASSNKSGNYHQALESLSEIVVSLPTEISHFISESIINNVISGKGVDTKVPATELEKLAQLKKLKHGKVLSNNDDISVLCGFPISKTSGDSNLSQFERIFGQGNSLLNETSVKQRETLIRSFKVSDTEMDLLSQLAGWNNATATLEQISEMYSWVLLSSVLGYNLQSLVIYNHLLNNPSTSKRYTLIKSVMDWQSKNKMNLSDLVVALSETSSTLIPVMSALMTSLKKEKEISGVVSKKEFQEIICNLFKLSSSHVAGLLIDWLDAEILSNEMSSSAFLKRINGGSFQYVMIRRISNSIDSDATIELTLDGTKVNESPDLESKSVTGNSWIQYGFQNSHPLESAAITITSKNTNLLKNSLIYVSDQDMSDWANKTAADEVSKDYILLGQTGEIDITNMTTYAYSDTPLMAVFFLNHLFQRLIVATGLNLTENVLEALPKVNKTLTASWNISRAIPGNAQIPTTSVQPDGSSIIITVPVQTANGQNLSSADLSFTVDGIPVSATVSNSTATISLPGKTSPGLHEYTIALNGHEQKVAITFSGTPSKVVDLLNSELKLNKKVLVTNSNDNAQITFTPKDITGQNITGLNVAFESSDLTIETVTPNGNSYQANVKAKDRAGKKTITVKIGGVPLIGKEVYLIINKDQGMLEATVNESKSILSVTSDTILSDESTYTSLVFSAKDVYGVPVSGLTRVNYNVTGFDDSTDYKLGEVKEIASGIYSCELHCTESTPKNKIIDSEVQVKLNNKLIGNIKKVVIKPTQQQLASLINNTNSSIKSDKTTLTPDGNQTAKITFTALSGVPGPVSGLTDVNIITNLGDIDVVKETSPGQYTTTLKGTQKGTADLNIIINGEKLDLLSTDNNTSIEFK